MRIWIVPLAVLFSWSQTAWAEPPNAGSPPPEPNAGASMRRAGWITAGSGAVVLAGSAVLFGVALNQHNEMTAETDHVDRSLDHSFDRNFRTAKILGLVGLVAVASGITLVVVAPEDHEVSLTAGAGELTLSGSF